MKDNIKSLANLLANRRSDESMLGITYTFSEKALQMFSEKVIEDYLSNQETSVKITEPDPCPSCRKGIVCRTPSCGRLKWNKL